MSNAPANEVRVLKPSAFIGPESALVDFRNRSGRILVADPCYGWHEISPESAFMDHCVTGLWRVQSYIHQGTTERLAAWSPVEMAAVVSADKAQGGGKSSMGWPWDIGRGVAYDSHSGLPVDSGIMSVCDGSRLTDKEGDAWKRWYVRGAIQIALNRSKNAGLGKVTDANGFQGVVCPSGYGDGRYLMQAIRNQSGLVIAVQVVFDLNKRTGFPDEDDFQG